LYSIKLNKTDKNLFFSASLILALFPILSIKLTSITIIIWGLIGLWTGRKFSFKKLNKILLFQILPFLVILIWYILVDSSKIAGYTVEKAVPFLIIPLICFIQPQKLSQDAFKLIILIFGICVILSAIWGHVNVFLTVLEKVQNTVWEGRVKELYLEPSFQHHYRIEFQKFSGIHPTYISMFIGFFMISLTYFTLSDWKIISITNKFLFTFLQLLCLGLLLVTASRTPTIATLLCITLIAFKYIKSNWKYIIVPAGICILFISAYLFIPSFKLKFNEVSIDNIMLPSHDNNDSFNVRTGIFLCSLEGIQSNWLLGFGAGNGQEFLNNCYSKFESVLYLENKFNTHNQYLDYWLNYGIVGLISLILFLFTSWYKSYQSKFLLGSLFVIFIAILMLTENILSRQDGILCALFFMSLINFVINEKSNELS
jgi:O-antigen ligase